MDKDRRTTKARYKPLKDITFHFTSSEEEGDADNDNDSPPVIPTSKHRKRIFASPRRDRIKLRPSIVRKYVAGFVSSTPMGSGKQMFNKSAPISPIINETEITEPRRRSISLQRDAVTSTSASFVNKNTPNGQNKESVLKPNSSAKKIDKVSNNKVRNIFPGNDSELVTSNVNNNSLAHSLPSDYILEENTKTNHLDSNNKILTNAQPKRTMSTYAQANLSYPELPKKFKSVLTQTVDNKGTQITDSLEKSNSKTSMRNEQLLKRKKTLKKRKIKTKKNYKNHYAHSSTSSYDDDLTLRNMNVSEHKSNVCMGVSTSQMDIDDVAEQSEIAANHDLVNANENQGELNMKEGGWLSGMFSQYLTDEASNSSYGTSVSGANDTIAFGPPHVESLNNNLDDRAKATDSKAKRSNKSVTDRQSKTSAKQNNLKALENIALETSFRNSFVNKNVNNIEADKLALNENDDPVEISNMKKAKSSSKQSSKVQILQNVTIAKKLENSQVINGLPKKPNETKSAKGQSKNITSLTKEPSHHTSSIRQNISFTNLNGYPLESNETPSIEKTQTDSVSKKDESTSDVVNKEHFKRPERKKKARNRKIDSILVVDTINDVELPSSSTTNISNVNRSSPNKKSQLSSQNAKHSPNKSQLSTHESANQSTGMKENDIFGVNFQEEQPEKNENLSTDVSTAKTRNLRNNKKYEKNISVNVANKENFKVPKAKPKKRNKRDIPAITVSECSDSTDDGIRRSKRERKKRVIHQMGVLLPTKKFLIDKNPNVIYELDPSISRDVSKLQDSFLSTYSSPRKQNKSDTKSPLKTKVKKKKSSLKTSVKQNKENSSATQSPIKTKAKQSKTNKFTKINAIKDSNNLKSKMNSSITIQSNFNASGPAEFGNEMEQDAGDSLHMEHQEQEQAQHSCLEIQPSSECILRDYFHFPQNNHVCKVGWCIVTPRFGKMAKNDCVRMAVGPRSSYAGFQAGLIEIPPGKYKPKDSTKKFSLVFIVMDGKGLFEVHDSYSFAERFTMVYVPLGAYYSIKNQSQTESLTIHYVQVKPQQ